MRSTFFVSACAILLAGSAVAQEASSATDPSASAGAVTVSPSSGGIAGAVESAAASAVDSAIGGASQMASSVLSSVAGAVATNTAAGGNIVTGNNISMPINGSTIAGQNGTNGTNGTGGALSLRAHITSGKEVAGFGLLAAGVYAGLALL